MALGACARCSSRKVDMGVMCSTTRWARRAQRRADRAAPLQRTEAAASSTSHPTRVIARRLRKLDMEWEFMVEWSDARPSSWVTHEELGASAQDLVTTFNMSKPGALAAPRATLFSPAHHRPNGLPLQICTDKANFGMQTLAYSCVQHLKRGSVHLRESSRRVCPAGRQLGVAGSTSLSPTMDISRLGVARQAAGALPRSLVSDLTARPLTAADEWQTELSRSSAEAKYHWGVRWKQSSSAPVRRRASQAKGLCGIYRSSTYGPQQRRQWNPRV